MNDGQAMPTPEDTQRPGAETTIAKGIYLISNRYTRTYLDLWGSLTDEGAPVYSFYYIEMGGLAQQHWLISPAEDGYFVIRNIGSGTVMEFEADGEEGKRLECKRRREGEPRQQWAITIEEGNYYSIRNAHFSDKVLAVYTRGKALDERIDVASGKYTIKGRRDRQWVLERRSCTVPELDSRVGACPILKEKEIGWPSDGIHGFIVIRDHTRDTLLRQSGLMKEVSRPALYDDKTFALKMKEVVQSWYAKTIRVEGYAVLFGVVCGSADFGSKSYNWYLMDDLCEIVFLDPLSGRELTAKGLQKRGFKATWAIC